MKQIFPLELISKLLVINVDGAAVLVDTGAPTSVGRSRRGRACLGPGRAAGAATWRPAASEDEPSDFVFLGERISLAPTFLGVSPDYLSRTLGARIDVLLGADVLTRFHFLVDAKARQITFSSDPITAQGTRVPLRTFMGIPIATAQVGDLQVPMFVDTGAGLSYLPAEVLANYEQVGVEQDFYPGFGEFETPVHKVPLSFSGELLTVTAGVLPDLLALTLTMGDAEGIIGVELMRQFTVEFALPGAEIRLQRHGS